MKPDRLSPGARINLRLGALAAVLVLTAAAGTHPASSLSESNDTATGKTVRVTACLGTLSTAAANMAAGQLASVKYAHAKDARAVAPDQQSFLVASAAKQVASARQPLAQGTSGQTATLEERSASATRITAIARRNGGNTPGVSRLSAETAHRIDEVNRNLQQMV